MHTKLKVSLTHVIDDGAADLLRPDSVSVLLNGRMHFESLPSRQCTYRKSTVALQDYITLVYAQCESFVDGESSANLAKLPCKVYQKLRSIKS